MTRGCTVIEPLFLSVLFLTPERISHIAGFHVMLSYSKIKNYLSFCGLSFDTKPSENFVLQRCSSTGFFILN